MDVLDDPRLLDVRCDECTRYALYIRSVFSSSSLCRLGGAQFYHRGRLDMARGYLLHHHRIIDQCSSSGPQRSHWRPLARAIPGSNQVVFWFLLCSLCRHHSHVHGTLLACDSNLRRIHCDDSMHQGYMAKLSGHSEPFTSIGGNHLTAAHIAFHLLEHPVSVSADPAAQAAMVLHLQVGPSAFLKWSTN